MLNLYQPHCRCFQTNIHEPSRLIAYRNCDPCTPQNLEAVTSRPILLSIASFANIILSSAVPIDSTFAVALGGVNLQGFMPSPTGQGTPEPTVADELNIEITPVERISDTSGFTFILPAAPRPTQGSPDVPTILNEDTTYVPDIKVLGGPAAQDESIKAPSISIVLPKPSDELQSGITREADQSTRISPGKAPTTDAPNSAPVSSSAGSQTSTKYWLYYILLSQVAVVAVLF